MQFFKPYGMRCGTDNFGISDGIDEISVRGYKLDFEPSKLHENPLKPRKCLPWFVVMFFSLLDLQETDKFKNLQLNSKDKLGKRYLTSNFMVKSLRFFIGGGSASQARLRHFIEV